MYASLVIGTVSDVKKVTNSESNLMGRNNEPGTLLTGAILTSAMSLVTYLLID